MNPVKAAAKTQTNDNPSRNLTDVTPGRSLAPPTFQLKASGGTKSEGEAVEQNFLCGSIGRDGDNNPSDLQKLGIYLLQAGVPMQLVLQIMDPCENGTLIDRYQKEVLHHRNPDGRADPGGPTITAMLDLKGKDVVRSWYAPKSKPKTKGKEGQAGAGPGFAAGGTTDIAPVIPASAYRSQLGGPNAVPISFLRSNMDAGKSDTYYRNNGCWQTCRYILIKSGFSPKGKSTADYMIEAASSGSKKAGNFKKWIGGVDSEAGAGKLKLDDMLEAGMPVIVGVNRNSKKHNARWTNTHREGGLSPTDHYVVIVGRVALDGGKVGYRFYDPGRTRTSDACAASNLLIVDNGYIAGQGYGSVYTMSEVRNTTNN